MTLKALVVILVLKGMCPCKYSSFAGGMAMSREISCDHWSKQNLAIASSYSSKVMTYLRLLFQSWTTAGSLAMKLDFEFACDQLNSTNHRLLLELSSSASCQHILTNVYTQLYLHGHITFKFITKLCFPTNVE